MWISGPEGGAAEVGGVTEVAAPGVWSEVRLPRSSLRFWVFSRLFKLLATIGGVGEGSLRGGGGASGDSFRGGLGMFLPYLDWLKTLLRVGLERISLRLASLCPELGSTRFCRMPTTCGFWRMEELSPLWACICAVRRIISAAWAFELRLGVAATIVGVADMCIEGAVVGGAWEVGRGCSESEEAEGVGERRLLPEERLDIWS